jgi:hypothetical protein
VSWHPSASADGLLRSPPHREGPDGSTQPAKETRKHIELTAEATDLARLYIRQGILSETKWVDAQRIAMATVARVDVLVSWNFKHIVNLERIRGYNSVNLKAGYSLLEIRTPREASNYDD